MVVCDIRILNSNPRMSLIVKQKPIRNVVRKRFQNVIIVLVIFSGMIVLFRNKKFIQSCFYDNYIAECNPKRIQVLLKWSASIKGWRQYFKLSSTAVMSANR